MKILKCRVKNAKYARNKNRTSFKWTGRKKRKTGFAHVTLRTALCRNT